MPNAINWFEIATADFARAQRFYEEVLATKLNPMNAPGRKMAAFPADWTRGELSGCITFSEDMRPSQQGALLFLNCGPDLAPALARVEPAGGKVVLPKTQIPGGEAGYMAIVVDTEGNRIGLHSPH
jgi:predicted enzyme related to lactoylglutathione lyase